MIDEKRFPEARYLPDIDEYIASYLEKHRGAGSKDDPNRPALVDHFAEGGISWDEDLVRHFIQLHLFNPVWDEDNPPPPGFEMERGVALLLLELLTVGKAGQTRDPWNYYRKLLGAGRLQERTFTPSDEALLADPVLYAAVTRVARGDLNAKQAGELLGKHFNLSARQGRRRVEDLLPFARERVEIEDSFTDYSAGEEE